MKKMILELFQNHAYRHCEEAKPTKQSRKLVIRRWIASALKRFAMTKTRGYSRCLLVLVFALCFQPVSAQNTTESSPVSDPLLLVTVAASGAFAYLIGGRFAEGAKRVVPALVTSSVFLATVAGSFILRKLTHPAVGVLLPGIALFLVVAYKSMITCPATGTPGCTCGLKS